MFRLAYPKRFSAMKTKDAKYWFYSEVDNYMRHVLCIILLRNSSNNFHHWCHELNNKDREFKNTKLKSGKSVDSKYVIDRFEEKVDLISKKDMKITAVNVLNSLNNDEKLEIHRHVLSDFIVEDLFDYTIAALRLMDLPNLTDDSMEALFKPFNKDTVNY